MRTGRAPAASLATGIVAAVALGLWPGLAPGHEERLLVGRIETIEPAQKLLVVVDTQAGARRRLEVNPETEVIACLATAGLAGLRPGAMVRVKYLERAGAAAEASSVFLIGNHR